MNVDKAFTIIGVFIGGVVYAAFLAAAALWAIGISIVAFTKPPAYPELCGYLITNFLVWGLVVALLYLPCKLVEFYVQEVRKKVSGS